MEHRASITAGQALQLWAIIYDSACVNHITFSVFNNFFNKIIPVLFNQFIASSIRMEIEAVMVPVTWMGSQNSDDFRILEYAAQGREAHAVK